ncbi:hypothetical protein ANCCAN_23661 [Ancylostoma caninum]|uniref:Uncharacterized protein n=1 Tax=Ancylostoma caninum TaxID=29170 RepID=A0A368FET7_ANCCA|nr:hypothetical protein ANCCAN_23661 [Ancylostoma caninum]
MMSPNSWVVFDQQYYQIGTPLHVNCLVTAIPLATVQFMRKRPSSGEPWIDVDRSELVELKGTYESGYLWNTTVQDDLDLKCEGERNGKVPSVSTFCPVNFSFLLIYWLFWYLDSFRSQTCSSI